MKHTLTVALALALALTTEPALAQLEVRSATADAGTATLFPAADSTLTAALANSASTPEATGSFLPLPRYGKWVSVTKWLTLATAIGLGTMAALVHEEAEDRFAELEAACLADPDNCRALTDNGAYADPQLESLFQDVVSKDRTARWSLIGAEVSFGISVLLFIVDFQKKGRPGDIPYEPDSEKSKLRLSAAPGELALRYYFR